MADRVAPVPCPRCGKPPYFGTAVKLSKKPGRLTEAAGVFYRCYDCGRGPKTVPLADVGRSAWRNAAARAWNRWADRSGPKGGKA